MIDSELAVNPQATGNMRWYVIHAYSGMEKSVKKGLEERIARSGMPEKFGRILVPSEEVVEIKGGAKSVTDFVPDLISTTSSDGTKIRPNFSGMPEREIRSSRPFLTLFSMPE